MTEKYNSKIPFPLEVCEVSSETIQILESENFFIEQFEFPEEAKTLFYERFGESLIKKFIAGDELIWNENEISELINMASVEQAVEELERKGILDVFVHDDGEKVVVLKKTFLPN